jgi:hypothetical protein
MLADLDETLRQLLKRDLAKHGFDGVEIVFDAPDKEWSATLSSPAVNLFLYDMREALEHRPIDWVPQPPVNGRAREMRPPLRIDASYSVTAWTRAVEDEHRLLSQVLAIFYAYGDLPEEILAGTLANQVRDHYPLHTRVAQTRQDNKSDFWTAVGGQYKASVDYVVTLSCESGTILERGPEVRTQTVRLFDRDVRSRLEEFHRLGGTVRDAAGEPVENAWIVVPGLGWVVTKADGRFVLEPTKGGEYEILVRGPDGSEARAEAQIPGDLIVDVTLGEGAKKPAKSAAKKPG